MSAETKAAIGAAIAAHVADEGQDAEMVGAWVVIAEVLSLADLGTGRATHWHEEDGDPYACRGLIEAARDVSRFRPVDGG